MYLSQLRLACVGLVALFLLATVAGSTHYAVSSPAPIEPMDLVTPGSAVAAGRVSETVFFDVRDATSYGTEHIDGAISVPLSKILCDPCWDDQLSDYAEATVIVYGADQDQARYAAAKLASSYGLVTCVLKGGLDAWKASGYGVSTVGSTLGEQGTGCVSLATADVQATDITALIATSGKQEAPAQWDWRSATHQNITGNWMTPVKSQGPCGSCWGFAAMGALEAVINIRACDPNLDIDLSEQQLLSCPTSSGGCSGWNAFWAYSYLLRSGGAIPESCFPYSANDRIPCDDRCADWQQKLMPISDYGSIRKPTPAELQLALVNHGPLVAEMAVMSGFGSYEGGIYEHPGEESTRDINHQVVIVGYNDNQQYWIVKNSWGADWGENGYFRIAYGDCMIEHYLLYVDFIPVIARMNGPYYGALNEAILFNAVASTGLLAPIASYSWDFGDGSTATGYSTTHSYTSEGTYTVRLTVTDEEGNQGTSSSKVYVDSTPPMVNITRPKQYRLYFFDEERRNLMFSTVIIGDILVAASASDSIAGLERLEYYVDGQQVYTTTDSSFERYWENAGFGYHRLEVRAYDRAGNVGTTKLRVWAWME